jgi:hypothetical protein
MLQTVLPFAPPSPEVLARMRGFETGEISTTRARRRPGGGPERFGGRFTRSPYQRTPDREASLERRRGLVSRRDTMPWRMEAKLTPCERALAAIIREDHLRTGYSDLCHDVAAVRIGACSKTVHRVQRRLEALGWITIEERPRPGRKHLPNIVRIVSREWLAWIERGPAKKIWEPPAGAKWEPPIGGQKCLATQSSIRKQDLAMNVPALAALALYPEKPLFQALRRLKEGVAEVGSAKSSPAGHKTISAREDEDLITRMRGLN